MNRTPDLSNACWRKSSYSDGGLNNCVEVADNFPGLIPVRDSKAPTGPALVFPACRLDGLRPGRTGRRTVSSLTGEFRSGTCRPPLRREPQRRGGPDRTFSSGRPRPETVIQRRSREQRRTDWTSQVSLLDLDAGSVQVLAVTGADLAGLVARAVGAIPDGHHIALEKVADFQVAGFVADVQAARRILIGPAVDAQTPRGGLGTRLPQGVRPNRGRARGGVADWLPARGAEEAT